jgi:hypothetical protein
MFRQLIIASFLMLRFASFATAQPPNLEEVRSIARELKGQLERTGTADGVVITIEMPAIA